MKSLKQETSLLCGEVVHENLLIELQQYFQQNGDRTYQNNNEWTKVITKKDNKKQ